MKSSFFLLRKILQKSQDSLTRFIYDKFARLITVEQGDSTWNYTYDAFNRKMSRTFSGETTQYLYNGNEDIRSYRNKKYLKILSAKEGPLPIAIELAISSMLRLFHHMDILLDL